MTKNIKLLLILYIIFLECVFYTVAFHPTGLIQGIVQLIGLASAVGVIVYNARAFLSKRKEVIDDRAKACLHKAAYYAFLSLVLALSILLLVAEYSPSLSNGVPLSWLSILGMGWLVLYLIVFLWLDFKGE